MTIVTRGIAAAAIATLIFALGIATSARAAPSVPIQQPDTIVELLAGEQFSTLHEAKVLIEQWRRHYNAVRPHSSLGYRPPAPETILPPASALPYAALRPDQALAKSGRTLT